MKRPPGQDMLQRAKTLRRDLTPQERILWRHLRDRRLENAKFRRQMWVAGFIADFASPDARLVVEADGSQHAHRIGNAVREQAFRRIGWRTLRFWNNEINTDLAGVLTAIRAALLNPLPEGERDRSRSDQGEGPQARRTTPIPSPGRPAADHPLPSRERGR